MNTTYIIIWAILLALVVLGAVFFHSYNKRREAKPVDDEKRRAAFLAMREFAYSDMPLDQLLELFRVHESPVQGAIEAVKAGDLDQAKGLLDKIEGPADVLSQMVRTKILLTEGSLDEARETMLSLLKPNEESRARVSAWAVLREMGHTPTEAEADQVLGVVCEFELLGVTALVSGYSDGDARLLTSKGFGMIGIMQQHPGISGAALELIESTKALLDTLEHTRSRPIPQPGMIRVTALTPAGMRAVYLKQSEIAEPDHPLNPIWNAMQNLLTNFRQMGEKMGFGPGEQEAAE